MSIAAVRFTPLTTRSAKPVLSLLDLKNNLVTNAGLGGTINSLLGSAIGDLFAGKNPLDNVLGGLAENLGFDKDNLMNGLGSVFPSMDPEVLGVMKEGIGAISSGDLGKLSELGNSIIGNLLPPPPSCPLTLPNDDIKGGGLPVSTSGTATREATNTLTGYLSALYKCGATSVFGSISSSLGGDVGSAISRGLTNKLIEEGNFKGAFDVSSNSPPLNYGSPATLNDRIDSNYMSGSINPSRQEVIDAYNLTKKLKTSVGVAHTSPFITPPLNPSIVSSDKYEAAVVGVRSSVNVMSDDQAAYIVSLI
jgi:hypothetical protein